MYFQSINQVNIKSKSFWLIFSMATLLNGCSFNYSFSFGGLNMEKLEKTIQTDLQAQIKIPISSVECPEERDQKQGDEFECIAKGDQNSEFKITVTQKDDDGNVDWNLVSATNVINLDIVESQIIESLEQQTGVTGVVNCGEQQLMVATKGTTFECQGKSDRGEVVTITVEVEDEQGGYRWYTKK